MTSGDAPIAVFGLGEAGSLIAGDLAASGCAVRGFDPAPVGTPAGVERCADPVRAVEGVGIVLGITAAADAETALTQALGQIPVGAIYADLATDSPGAKRARSAIAAVRRLAFVDVALMSPVPDRGLRTPALASGPAAEVFVATMAPLGMPVRVAGPEVGEAAARKLLRSVVIKGLAALLIESMRAAEAAGLGDDTWHELVRQVSTADDAFMRRLVDGSVTHVVRRLHEMDSTARFLDELGVEPVMTRATVEHLRRLAGEGLPPLPRD